VIWRLTKSDARAFIDHPTDFVSRQITAIDEIAAQAKGRFETGGVVAQVRQGLLFGQPNHRCLKAYLDMRCVRRNNGSTFHFSGAGHLRSRILKNSKTEAKTIC
jgi:hypothetical protein